MRKLRTILSVLVLTLVSVFVSACSCGGGGEGGFNVNHIYAQTINLKCLTNNDTVNGEVDPNSKDLYITCHIGDRFVIEYEITPSNATTTQVDWEFDSAGVGIVEPYRSEGYTRNKSTKEQVEFEAKARSDSKYKTTLTFTVHELNKSAKAYIEVYPAVTSLSSFVTPDNVNFDNSNNCLTWSAVTKVKNPSGDVVDAKISAGYPIGLAGYEIVRLDPITNEQIDAIYVDRYVTKYTGIQAGEEYSFKVRAIGDKLNAKDGEFTNPFKFYKIKAVEEISNEEDDNLGGTGSISFKAPLRSAKSIFYYFGLANAGNYTPYEIGTTGGSSLSFPYTSFVDKAASDEYKIEVISYPDNYNSIKGYGEVSGIRYYPSDVSEALVIKKLVEPEIALATDKGTITIDGVDFADSYRSTYVALSTSVDYNSEGYDQEYYYELFIEGSLQEPQRSGRIKDRIALSGLASGSYVLQVTTIGNRKTIHSSTSDLFRFNILDHLTDYKVTLNNDKIINSQTYTTGGIEIFFVSKDTQNKQQKSVRKVISGDDSTGYNIQELGLHHGYYDVYANSISYIEGEYKNVSILPDPFNKLFSIEIAPTVTSNMITKEGVIYFKKLNKFDNYEIILNRKEIVANEFNEEQRVYIYAPTPENISHGLLTYEVSYNDENNSAVFDSEGHNARISIEKIVESYISDVYGEMSLAGFFSSNHQFKYSIITVGEYLEGTNVISSSPTTTFEIQRYAPVSTIKLQDYKLVFDRVGSDTRQQYSVCLYTYNKEDRSLKNNYEFESFLGVFNSQNKIEVDLKDLIVKGGSDKFIDLIDVTAINKVAICALGSDGKVNTPAILNSIPTEQTFEFTTTPYGLTMNSEGIVSWKTSVVEDENNLYSYTVFFYLTTNNDGVLEYSLEHSIKNISASSTVLEDFSSAVLSIDVNDILSNYQDQVIAISVQENRADMFSGLESDYLYASRISSPNLERKTTDGKYTISWETINNADVYDISVTKENDQDFSYISNGTGNTFLSITDRLTDATTPWNEGVYTIFVSARSNAITDPADNAFDNPYVLTSVPSSMVVNIVNAKIETAVNGNLLTWANVCGEDSGVVAEHSLTYELSNGDTDTENIGTSLSYDASCFKAGTNKVTITPTISFEESSYIIVGTAHDNAIEKWEAPYNLACNKGNLTLYVKGATNTETPIIELYQEVSGVSTLISNSLYSYDIPSELEDDGVIILKYTIILDGMDAGELTLSAKVKSLGKLDSDLSTSSCTATKIAAVTDLRKQGNYLIWSAQPGISTYEIGYLNPGSTNYTYIDFVVEEDVNGIYTPYVAVDNGEGTTQLVQEDKFRYDSDTKQFYLLFTEDLFLGSNSGDTYINIRPLTEKNGYFCGNTSASITVTRLNCDIEKNIENGILTFSKYVADGSATPTYYSISIFACTMDEDGNIVVDGEGNVIKDTSKGEYKIENVAYESELGIDSIDLNVIGLQESGNYAIALQFIGNGNEVVNSKVVTFVELDKLETTALRTQDGILTWGSVDGAENYTVQISDGSKQYEFVVTGEILKEEELILPSQDLEEVNISSLTRSNNFSFLPGVWYTVKIKANASDKLHSKWSEEFKVKKLYAPTNIQTKASVGSFDIQVEVTTETSDGPIITTETRTVSLGTPIITWDDRNTINLKSGYYLQYSNQYYYDIPHNTSLAYMLETGLPVDVYGIQMRVYGNSSSGTDNSGYLNSDLSEVYQLQYIEDVINPRVNSGIVSWTSIDCAYSYKVTAYKTSEYKDYISNTGSDLPDVIFSATAPSNNFNLTNLVQNANESGSYTFVVNALARPEDLIVTTHGEKSNTVNVFKPSVFTEYKVKDGRLNWKVPVEEVLEFVASQETVEGTNLAIQNEEIDRANPTKVAQEVLAYTLRKVNMGVGENEQLEEQIKHLISVRIQVNGVTFTDIPSQAKIIDVAGNEITVESGYASGEYLEYYYDVEIEPEIKEETPEEPELGGGEEVITSSLVRGNNSAGVEYVAGKYTIRLSAIGNSDEYSPVVNGVYTREISAYKPNTPKTWTTDGADIYKGKVQWELSTTEKSTIDNFVYYEKYRIRAVEQSNSSVTTIKVNVNDTYNSATGTNPNLTNNYLYYRDLKEEGTNEGLFTVTGSKNNEIYGDTFYRLFISTEGTADSSLLADGETIYLNSNECVVNRPVNILHQTKDVKIEYSNLSWGTSPGSTATKLYIYGPFDCWDAYGTKVNTTWKTDKVSDDILSKIEAVHVGNFEGLTSEEINKYKNMLHIIELSEEEGIRQTNYSLTDQFDFVNNCSMYAPGGYLIKTQELGDNKGVVDSQVNEGVSAIKFGIAAVQANTEDDTDIMQEGGWVGLSDSIIYEWNNSTASYIEKTYTANSPNEKVGVFVWNPVIGANSYEVEVYYFAPGSTNGEYVLTEIVRGITTYSLPETELCKREGKYSIRIKAMHTTTIMTTGGETTYPTPNSFKADYIDSTQHERVRVPENLIIFGNGDIQWNNGYSYNDIASYRVQFNYGSDGLSTEIIAETGTDSYVPVLNMGTGNQNGTVEISIKAIAVSGNDMLNSEYCVSVKVTRLADPDMRLENGVLYWGNINGSDPITATEYKEDNKEVQIIDKKYGETSYETFIKYYTDITAYDSNYKAQDDENKFTTGEHTFTTRYQGTGGNSGSAMSGGETFYIASNSISLNATKLKAPVIENVTHSVNAGNQENMVKWEFDENALGYRIRVFATVEHPKGFPYSETNVSSVKLLELLNNGTGNTNFYVEEDKGKIIVYFKLNPVIKDEFNLLNNGGDIYIFVQALGSGLNISQETLGQDLSARPDDATLYLSSSYSSPTSVGVPPNPTELDFNENTGLFKWSINSATPYNIKINSVYKVINVTEDELKYWKESSDKFYNADGSLNNQVKAYTAYPEIIYRETKVVYSYTDDQNDPTKNIYDLLVKDLILLTVSNNDGKTPLSYNIKTTGINYQLSVTAMSFINDESSFVSDEVSLTGTQRTFQTFDGGDGHVNNPYKISSLTQLKDIGVFTTSAFVITEDIEFVDPQGRQIYWNVIPTFEGVLDGGNHTIDNLSINVATESTNGLTDIMALFENNKGTIKNLKVNISDDCLLYSGITDGVNVATIAINNHGTIDNVHVTGIIEVLPTGIINSNISTYVGGLVVNNKKNGIIANCSAISMNISALDDMDNYASVGGIATINQGNINNTRFDGQLLSNRLGGITAVNSGLIDRCYVTENTVLNVTNKCSKASTLTGAIVGGISAVVSYDNMFGLEKASIKNSYSLATIKVTKAGDASAIGYSVGGLVGTLTANVNVEIANCYVVVNIVKDEVSGSAINVYQMIGDTKHVVLTNNYYIVSTCELTVSDYSLNTTGVCELVSDISTLKTKLATLKDENNQQVYSVTDTEYPVLYRSE